MLVHHANYFSNKILLKLFGLRVGIYTNKSDSQKLSLFCWDVKLSWHCYTKTIHFRPVHVYWTRGKAIGLYQQCLPCWPLSSTCSESWPRPNGNFKYKCQVMFNKRSTIRKSKKILNLLNFSLTAYNINFDLGFSTIIWFFMPNAWLLFSLLSFQQYSLLIQDQKQMIWRCGWPGKCSLRYENLVNVKENGDFIE